MSTSPVFMTATAAGPGNIAFLEDGTGQECVIFTGGPVPSTIRITDLGSADGYNMTDNWRNLACQIVLFEPQFTIGPSETVTRQVNGGGVGFGLTRIFGGAGTTHVRVEWGAVATPACAFGTEMIDSSSPVIFLTQAIIADIIAAIAAPEVVVAWLVGFYATNLYLSDLCSKLPPPVPVIDLQTPTRSAATLKQLLDAAAWPRYCRCSPGTPSPTPPPAPVIVVPPGSPTLPPFACSNIDLCASIVQVLEQQRQLQTVVNQLYQLVTVTQRYDVPFAYIRGRSLGSVSGSGQVAIDRLVGIQAVVDDRPDNLRTFTGAPTYVSDLGWISAITADGLIDEIRLTRDVQAWFSKLLPSATSLGWALREGVSVTFTELLAEP